MLVNEIFYSLQGEGFLAGTPSVFIRLPKCPLRCKWCDTSYALDEKLATDYLIEDIIKTVNAFNSNNVVITGGEPMVNPMLPELAQQLKKADKHITIETAGIVFLPNLHCDLMSISPKLSNSLPDDPDLAKLHEKMRLDLAVLSVLIEDYNDQLKFVVDSETDIDEINQILQQLPKVKPNKVMLMPQAATRDQLLKKSPVVAKLCIESNYAFSQRLQVMLWDNQRGK